MANIDLVSKIKELKKKKNAVILVHNYQPEEVQDIADFLGDSLELSQKAASTDADIIVFCGVHFMAETAAILSPKKTVLLPDVESGCPMADMIDAKKLIELKKNNPGAIVVTYVNSTAAVKAETDVCCTSANAVKIVNSLKNEKIIFVPDKNLGKYVISQTGKDMVLFDGYCPIHANIFSEHVKEAKKKYPNAEVLSHPECLPDVIKQSDKTVSTSGMVKYVKESKNKEFIIATEPGIIYRMKKDNPDKEFYPASETAVCKNMKKNNLEKVYWALDEMKYVIKVDPKIQEKAVKAIEKMLQSSKE